MKRLVLFLLLGSFFQQSSSMEFLASRFIGSRIVHRAYSTIGFNATRLAWLRKQRHEGREYAERYHVSSRGTVNCLDGLQSAGHFVVMDSDPKIVQEGEFRGWLKEKDLEPNATVDSRTREKMKDYHPEFIVCFSPREVADAKKVGAKPIVVCKEQDRRGFKKCKDDVVFTECIADVTGIVADFEKK